MRPPQPGTFLPASLVPLQRSVLFVASAEEERASLQAQMRDLLATLLAYEPFSGPFRAPVRESEAPNYAEIVKHPMDLQTLAQRVEAHLYTGRRAEGLQGLALPPSGSALLTPSLPPALREFVADLQLIFYNCRLYNTAPGNEFVALANAMEAKARTLLSDLPLVVVVVVVPDGHSVSAATPALSDAALAEQASPSASPSPSPPSSPPGFSLQCARQRTFDLVSENYRVQLMANRRFCHGEFPGRMVVVVKWW
jgi:hypothetical protein